MPKRSQLVSELRAAGEPELTHRLATLREELFKLRFQRTMKQLDNPMRVGQVRKEIARIETLLTERVKGIKR